MARRTVRITLPEGLHARPAAELAQLEPASCDFTLRGAGTEPVDGRCVLSVLALGVRAGEEVELVAEGDGARLVLDRAERILAAESLPAA